MEIIIPVFFQIVLPTLFYAALILSVVFFAVHAAEHIADPIDRGSWVLLIVMLPIFGATLYLLTKYRRFWSIGKGKWIPSKSKTPYFPSKEFYCLSDAERNRL